MTTSGAEIYTSQRTHCHTECTHTSRSGVYKQIARRCPTVSLTTPTGVSNERHLYQRTCDLWANDGSDFKPRSISGLHSVGGQINGIQLPMAEVDWSRPFFVQFAELFGGSAQLAPCSWKNEI